MDGKGAHKNSPPPPQRAELGSILTWGLLMFPDTLSSQLPMMIASLDADEYINTDRIRNNEALRTYLQTYLMPQLPVEYVSNRGWSRRSVNVCVSDVIAEKLAATGEIVATPTTNTTTASAVIRVSSLSSSLSSAQSTAYRIGVPRLLQLLSEFPDLRTELPSFLENMQEGNRVQLDGMEDENVADGLSRFLKSIGMEEGKKQHYLPFYVNCFDSLLLCLVSVQMKI
jgi:hypothetical protein